MDTQQSTKVDQVLGILLISLLTVFMVFCSSLLDPYASLIITDDYFSDVAEYYDNPEEEMEVDNDFVTYQDFVSQLTLEFQNKEYAISLRYFPDSQKDFDINGDKIMGAASTYKLFTAYSMYIHNQAPSCLRSMIVYSDNTCPENWGGWGLVTQDAYKIGALSTNISAVPTLTTANDLSLFLTKLYDGSLLPENETAELLSYMLVQVYREGIPAGIPDAEVADKVGFLDGVLNDAGIVYSEKGNFVLVILTDGYSWQSIANTASRIYDKL